MKIVRQTSGKVSEIETAQMENEINTKRFSHITSALQFSTKASVNK